MPYLDREDKRRYMRDWYERSGRNRPGCQVDHIFDLDREFPDLEIFGPQCVSAHAGLGWNLILRDALAAISRTGGKVTQIKQKFGELRIYWDPPEERRHAFLEWIDGGKVGPCPYLDPLHVAADAAVARATSLSLATCENCGTTIDPPRGQSYQTLCDGCTK